MTKPAAERPSASRLQAMRRVRGDLYELREPSSDTRLWNADLAPARTSSGRGARTTWLRCGWGCRSASHLHAGGRAGAGGMSWWQALLTILLGNLIVLVPMVLIAHPGTRFGIPFPVLARASFGTRGANVPAILRGLVACGWFGIQTWIGGQAIQTLMTTAFPGWRRDAGGDLDLVLRLLALEHLHRRQGKQCHQAAGGLGRAVPDRGRSRAARLGHGAGRGPGADPGAAEQIQKPRCEFLRLLRAVSLTAMVESGPRCALNIPDLSRFARDQRAQGGDGFNSCCVVPGMQASSRRLRTAS